MVAVAMPWRSAPKREALFTVTTEHYARLGLPIFTADSDEDKPFSRSQAINRAVALAFEAGHGTIVISDADTLVQAGPLARAVDMTSRDGKSRLPYDKYILMTQGQTNLYVHTGRVTGDVYEGACSGVLVVRVDTFYQLGQFDERYVGWGYEDIDFAVRAQFERVPGTCWGMYHEPDERAELTAANKALLRDTHGDV
jgi:hypothetical protein